MFNVSLVLFHIFFSLLHPTFQYVIFREAIILKMADYSQKLHAHSSDEPALLQRNRRADSICLPGNCHLTHGPTNLLSPRQEMYVWLFSFSQIAEPAPVSSDELLTFRDELEQLCEQIQVHQNFQEVLSLLCFHWKIWVLSKRSFTRKQRQSKLLRFMILFLLIILFKNVSLPQLSIRRQ